jgi:NADH-quinone oxidoreductase subunit J
MPTVEALLFWTFAGIALFGAYAVVTCERILYSTLSLILVFLSISAFFVLNNADFLAIAQLIVYAVGMTIILLFGVMFTGEENERPADRRSQNVLFAMVCALFGGLVVAVMQFPFATQAPSAGLVATLQTQGSTALLGKLLYTQYVLPFELASVLLLAAMVGAIIIAKKRLTPEDEAVQRDVTRLPLNLSSTPKVAVPVPSAESPLVGVGVGS